LSGISIALMGIDGSGKSTLARALRKELTDHGVEVVDVSWSGVVDALPAGFPRTSIEQLGVQGWRLFYAGRTIDERPVDELVPQLFSDFGASDLPRRIGEAKGQARQPAVVTSALVELAGHFLLQSAVATPVIERGGVALNDGFGLKNVLKCLRLAEQMPSGEVPARSLRNLAEQVTAMFSDPFLQPDVGLLLDADPRLSYEWRMTQNGRLGVGEDLGFAGRPGRDTYLSFQGAMASEYRSAAERWGWHVLDIDGRPQAETVEEGVRVMLGHDKVRSLLSDAQTASAPQPTVGTTS
jgi:thymidylate kinase